MKWRNGTAEGQNGFSEVWAAFPGIELPKELVQLCSLVPSPGWPQRGSTALANDSCFGGWQILLHREWKVKMEKRGRRESKECPYFPKNLSLFIDQRGDKLVMNSWPVDRSRHGKPLAVRCCLMLWSWCQPTRVPCTPQNWSQWLPSTAWDFQLQFWKERSDRRKNKCCWNQAHA